MKADIRLSTRFLTTQNAHQVGMLVTLAGEAPLNRAPINVALVLDRSGSMAGLPLEAAKEAAGRFASFLTKEDRLSVVVFDETVETIFKSAPAGDSAALDAIARVYPGGSTNLSGGWLKGRKLVEKSLVEGTNRVLLLTDGQANVGIVDPAKLIGLAKTGASRRVSTTCIGFGADFNEGLLEPMAAAGAGNYWYVESYDQMAAIFQGEIEGLVALAAQNVELEVRLTHPHAAGVSFMQSYPVETTSQGTWKVALNDLYATSPRSLGLVFHVEDVRELGKVQLGEVRVEADVITEEGIAHRTIVMPVVANLDGEERIEPTVEQTFLRFHSAKAREEAIRQADQGNFGEAAASLREAVIAMSVYEAVPEIADEMSDLVAEADRLDANQYEATDRKYHGARAMANRDLKSGYARSVSRRKPRAS
ncbi:MAG: VWA domain-containing protein [Gemmatimonadales bacterium]